MFHYEIGASAPGRYTLGPFRVTAQGQTYQSGTIALTVSATPGSLPGGAAGSSAASLVTEVNPRAPWVGEPVILRVRLIQRAFGFHQLCTQTSCVCLVALHQFLR